MKIGEAVAVGSDDDAGAAAGAVRVEDAHGGTRGTGHDLDAPLLGGTDLGEGAGGEAVVGASEERSKQKNEESRKTEGGRGDAAGKKVRSAKALLASPTSEEVGHPILLTSHFSLLTFSHSAGRLFD